MRLSVRMMLVTAVVMATLIDDSDGQSDVDHSLTFRTGTSSVNSGSPDTLTVDIFSDDCVGACTTATVSGLTAYGNGCQLSTDTGEGSPQVTLDVDEDHSLTLKTSTSGDSGSPDSLAVDIFSDDCDGVCATTTVSGLTETNGCDLSTDASEGSEQVAIDVDVEHSLTLWTSTSSVNAGSPDQLTVEIFSDVCDDVCATTTVSGLTDSGGGCRLSKDGSEGGEHVTLDVYHSLTFMTSALDHSGSPDSLIVEIISDDCDGVCTETTVEVYNVYTGEYYRFTCPSEGCHLSTDPTEGSEQMVIDIDALSDLTIVDTGPHHINLAWTGPANVNRVAWYRLRYKQAGSSYQEWSPPPAPGDTTATVSGLWADTEYNFTLTAFGENDEQIGEISGTGTTAPVIVNVGCHQDHMTVTFPREALTGVDVDNMHLLNDSCRATVTNESVTFTTGLQDCGTIEDSSEAGILIFSNAAIGAPVMADNGAVRGAPFSETFQCEFTSQFVVSQGEEILYNIPSPRVQVVDGNNRFTFEMHTFTSSDFTETYKSADYPLKVSSSDNFNFGLSVDSPLDNLELFALDCLATPSTDPEDTPSVSIIEDGCDVDPTLELDTAQSNDMALYYSIQSFTFPNIQPPNLVYIHCTMVVCFKDDPNSRCSEGCSASRRRRAVSDMAESRVRRASERDHSAQVTQGPFEVEGGQKQASTTPTVGIAVGTVAGIAGVLLLVVAVFLVRKRRGRGINKNAEDRVGFDNYSFEVWGKGKFANDTPKPE
ncbi:hypothetical protein Bbelb_178090 [Branchiostoma belcheri]|nr:hypothetical protein Bbelb_178090 [Branchiostoma belcheri]